MKVKINHVFYCYHPDFIQNGDSYELTGTGNWSVEWCVREQNTKPSMVPKFDFYRADFATEEEAKQFQKKLMNKQEKNGTILEEEDFCIAKKYHVGSSKKSTIDKPFNFDIQFQVEHGND